jgi:hypothetical protein
MATTTGAIVTTRASQMATGGGITQPPQGWPPEYSEDLPLVEEHLLHLLIRLTAEPAIHCQETTWSITHSVET